MKICCRCKEEKDNLKFHKKKTSTDGLHSFCKDCYNRYYREKRSIDKTSNKEGCKRWEEKNKEYRLNYHKEYRRNNQETCIRGRILTGSRKRARDKQLEFNIDKEWVDMKLSNGICEITGIPFVYEAKSPFTPSIDRIDSLKGYTKDNCQLVCKIYNFAKNEFTDADVLTMAKAIISKNGDTQ